MNRNLQEDFKNHSINRLGESGDMRGCSYSSDTPACGTCNTGSGVSDDQDDLRAQFVQ